MAKQKPEVNKSAAVREVLKKEPQTPVAEIVSTLAAQGIKISADGKKVFVTNFGNDQVTVVDAAERKIVGRIGGFNKIRAISLTGHGICGSFLRKAGKHAKSHPAKLLKSILASRPMALRSSSIRGEQNH